MQFLAVNVSIILRKYAENIEIILRRWNLY